MPPPRDRLPEPAPGVYARLEDLIRVQHQAQGFSFLPRQPVHSLLTGRYASRLRGRGLNFEELRGYLPGDDIRSIDWKATVRTRQPTVRVYTEERDRPQLYLVDQRLSMFFGSRERMKSVTAAEAAALGAWRALSVGDRPGAIVFSDREIREIPPHRSRTRVMQILAAVLEQNHALRLGAGASNPGMLNQVLARAVRRASHDWLVCIISDFDGADAEETRRLLTRLAQHNDVIAALVYDPLETELPDAGQLVVSDGELQLEFDSGDARLRRRFSEVFSERLQQAREALLKRDIPVLPLHTAEGVAEQVRQLLGHAPRTRRA